MPSKTSQEKFRFWMNWTLLSLTIIPLSYMISLIGVLLVQGAFGFGQTEWGTPLSNTLSQIAGGTIIGLGTGIFQRSILRKVFNISSSWIYTLIIGFVATELIAGIVLWQLDLDREKLRFLEFNPLPEALIFAFAGLMIGLLQWTILRKYFFRSGFWVLASTAGWGICVLMTYFVGLVNRELSVFAFILGSLFYGAITGATFMWILQKKT